MEKVVWHLLLKLQLTTTVISALARRSQVRVWRAEKELGATPSLSYSPYNTYGPKHSKPSLAAFKPATLRFQNPSHHRRPTSLFESDLSGQRSSGSIIPHQQQQEYGRQQRQAFPSQP
ncbi:hypothetical protein BASA50_010322 [Batrachochytrium salamandrivorans]|uniref:Uncharacterized protein n=1 Tax=Batrachochytrium salamandrivorans TaxID=1357716 RepID=A0ABQ8EZZ7_9FUNG|nr:hypothetical protein BASA50_010322 [Batrachochytrium salamandrivorans]